MEFVDEPLRFLDTAVRQPEACQPCQGVGVNGGQGVPGQAHGRLQFFFGLHPVADGCQYRAVQSAAASGQERAAEPANETVGSANPLDRALERGTTGTGPHRIATGVDGGERRVALAGQRSRHSFVDMSHSLADVTKCDELGADLTARTQFEGAVILLVGQVERLASQ
ncbi:hypothetical protein EF847_10370 [Actinobacteria bacterium YIM 96077]|nr:hypothetical protein EF847_10370 [Actinobacteria bacterium YIM 96077]